MTSQRHHCKVGWTAQAGGQGGPPTWKVLELLYWNLLCMLQEAVSQAMEGIHMLALPVSKQTVRFCGGMPIATRP